jgi:hypothetical protein
MLLASIFFNQYSLLFILTNFIAQVIVNDGIDPDNMTYEVCFMNSFGSFFLLTCICDTS